MKSALEKVSTLERRLNIEVPASAVNASFERWLKNIQKQANIKGFRPGKAPLPTIKTMYADKVAQEVVNDLIQKHYFLALQEHKVEPVSYPQFDFKAPTENADFAFTANFEIRPEVKLKKYEGLEVLKEKLVFDNAKVDEVLENIRGRNAKLVDVLEDRSAQKGDIAVIDFEGFVDGKALEGGKGENHNLELGTNQFIEGFEEGVIGMKVGSEKTLHLKFPDPYHSADLSGKPVEFKVKLAALKKKELPTLDDEYLKSIGSTETLTELKESLRKRMEKTENDRIEQEFRNELLKALVKANPVEVPASMLKEQKAALIENMRKDFEGRGVGGKEFDDYVQKWDKDFETTASEMIQSAFLVDEIAEKHNLKWQPADLDAKFAQIAKENDSELDKVKEFYGRPELQQRLTYTITENKVIEFLTNTAVIKNK